MSYNFKSPISDRPLRLLLIAKFTLIHFLQYLLNYSIGNLVLLLLSGTQVLTQRVAIFLFYSRRIQFSSLFYHLFSYSLIAIVFGKLRVAAIHDTSKMAVLVLCFFAMLFTRAILS